MESGKGNSTQFHPIITYHVLRVGIGITISGILFHGKNIPQYKHYSCIMTLVFCFFSSRFSFFNKIGFLTKILGKFVESSVCKLDGPHLSVGFLYRPRKEGIGTISLLHVPSSFARGQYLICQTQSQSFLWVFWKVIQSQDFILFHLTWFFSALFFWFGCWRFF